MLFLERNREFCSCSPREMCKFQIDENEADAHASMPFCGMLQFAVSAYKPVIGR